LRPLAAVGPLAAALLVLALAAGAGAQVNGHVQYMDDKPILTVWGTHAERGYAAGYLMGAQGKEMFDDYIVGYCCSGSMFIYAYMRNHYVSNYAVDAKYVAEAEAVIDGMADAGISLYNTTLMRNINATDMLVANAIVDLSTLSSVGPFACSSMSSWGASTVSDPYLDGHLVVTRFLDWSKHPTLTDNALLTVHFPSEADEQPWICIGYAGLFGALSAISESGLSAFLNMGNNESSTGGAPYHPILLSVRNGVESTDYDGDGHHTPFDVVAAIQDRSRNIDTIVHVTQDDGPASRPLIIESNNAAGVAVRDCSDNTTVPGDNLVATNHFRVLYPPIYCNRYEGICDSLNVSTDITCDRSWSLMAGAAGSFVSNIQCMQYVESEDLLLWSVDTHEQPAYSQPPTELSTRELFGCLLGTEETGGTGLHLRNSPNPFADATTISFGLKSPAGAKVAIYNVRGGLVRTLLDGVVPPGTTRLLWDGRNDAGRKVGTGVYLCRIETELETATGKMILLR
jgi:hypothetical protein